MPNIDQDLARIMEARYGKDVRQSIHDAIKDINDVAESQLDQIEADMNTATQAANQASASATAADLSKNQASNAATTASEKAIEASGSATTASEKAIEASSSATAASNAATNAHDSEINAHNSETNAKTWSDRAVDAAQSISGGIIPKGTIEFSDLPSISDSSIGDMYIISDAFTSTSDFEDGGGYNYSAGTKVYLIASYKWAVEPSSSIAANDLLVTPEEM